MVKIGDLCWLNIIESHPTHTHRQHTKRNKTSLTKISTNLMQFNAPSVSKVKYRCFNVF